MTPQLAYALRRVGIMIALAVLGVAGIEYTSILEAAGIDGAIYGGIVAAIIAGAVRAVEGKKDGDRAKIGAVIKEDVKPIPIPSSVFDPEIVFDSDFR